ncbi:hypothetical protein MMC13_004735 [Lambiella insularis]|nr:hypothetical protein [Lambiella insularis]
MALLKTTRNVNVLETALLNLPENLDAAYDEKMQRIINQKPRRNAEWAMEILYWVVCTKRPLSLQELQHALAVKQGNTEYNPDYETSEADIVLCTACLVSVDFDKRAVRMHVTFHDYLYRERVSRFPQAEFNISMVLLTYLNFKELELPSNSDTGPQIEARLERLPLLAYASQYWGDHVPQIFSEPEVQSVFVEFVSHSGKLASCLQVAYYVDMKLHNDLDVRKGLNGLHIFALYGLDSVIDELVSQKGIPVNEVDPKYEQTALMYACRNGHLIAVKKLLDLGAAINVRSARDKTAFTEAYFKYDEAHRCIALLLLDQEDFRINEPLMVDDLLKREEIDTNMQDMDSDTALSLAVINQNTAVVKSLLAHRGIDIDLSNVVGTTPLAAAARLGSTEIVDLLLLSGANASIKDRQGGGTPLQRAVDEGRTSMVQMFLHHEVDIHGVDDSGRGLLHSASINGHEQIARLFLEAGLSKDATGTRRETSLHDASRQGHSAVVKVLLEAGANKTINDKSGRTPATVAWQNGHIELMRLLEGKDTAGVNVANEQIPDKELLPTIQQVHQVESDSDPSPPKPDFLDRDPDTGNTALHYAVLRRRNNILALLSTPLSPDPPNNLSRTPLHLAALQNDLNSTRILLRHAARLDLLDTWHMTPLTIALNSGALHPAYYTLATVLLAAGALLDEANRVHIQPAFFAAVRAHQPAVVAYLISKGADHLRPEPRTGATAKQITRETDDVEMLRTLDTHKSEYFAYRSDSQRSEDYASATSSLGERTPVTTPGSIAESTLSDATPPLTPFSPLVSPPFVVSPVISGNKGWEFSKPAFRPRPRPVVLPG